MKAATGKVEKKAIKNTIGELEQQLLKVKQLEDSDYIIFYLDVCYPKVTQPTE